MKLLVKGKEHSELSDQETSESKTKGIATKKMFADQY